LTAVIHIFRILDLTSAAAAPDVLFNVMNLTAAASVVLFNLRRFGRKGFKGADAKVDNGIEICASRNCKGKGRNGRQAGIPLGVT
jgi:hypothetical protein